MLLLRAKKHKNITIAIIELKILSSIPLIMSSVSELELPPYVYVYTFPVALGPASFKALVSCYDKMAIFKALFSGSFTFMNRF